MSLRRQWSSGSQSLSTQQDAPRRRRINRTNRNTFQGPVIAYFFHAVIALKRLVRMRQRYKKKINPMEASSTSAFLNEIHKSHRAVKYASFGRQVVSLEEEKIRQHRADEKEQLELEKAKKQERLEKLSRRRGGANLKDVQANLVANILSSPSPETAVGMGRPDKSSVVDKIRALKTSFPVNSSQSDDAGKKSKVTTGFKETTGKDMSHILQKNAHISMTHSKKSDPNKTNKIRNNLKIMKKMNIQEVLNYAAGTAVYFGATVALQSRHGGFLSFNKFSDIKASAPKILPSARFVVWNCDDLSDHGILRYGDAVWLQAGVHEVLGAQYSGGTISADGTRKLKPSLINCRRENTFKAQQYGRWIVLNRENPSQTLGDQVLHQDKIMLEQEWCFLASHTPYDSFMEKSHSFQDSEMKGGDCPDFFKPIEECIWKLHLVTLPSDDNSDARFREYLLDQAKEQIQTSSRDRCRKERVLSGPLSRRISNDLRPEEVIRRHLPQTMSKEATQMHLLKKYDKQKLKGFTNNGTSVASLRHIYGKHSLVYKNAKATENSIREKYQENNLNNDETQKYDDTGGPKLSLEETEDLYWDLATNVLADTRAWESLPASMEAYEDLDQSKKEIAVRTLQRFARIKLSNMFSWKRVMNNIDMKETSRLSNSLLYQASQPVKKPAMIEEEERLAAEEKADKTFLTSAPNESYPRKVSKAHLSELTPELNRLQQVMHIEAADSEDDDKPTPRKHFRVSHDYFRGAVNFSRPNTAPSQLLSKEKEDEELQDTRNMSRQDRKTLLASASASSTHAINAARMLLRGPSQKSLGDRPQSAVMSRTSKTPKAATQPRPVSTAPRASRGGVIDDDPVTEDTSPKNHSEAALLKKKSKKEKFDRIMDSMSKSQDPATGLPQDVFMDAHRDVSVSTSLSFLRASSSTPHIYSDIKTRRRKDKYGAKKAKRK